jgi:hypothetical protein
MPRVYEMPTHLQVEDVLIAGLTARQLVRLAVGVWLPDALRLGLAAGVAIAGLLFALVQPGGRPLDRWLLASVLFVVLPRRLTWRSGATPLEQHGREQTEWAELALQPAWVMRDTVSATQQEQRKPTSRIPHGFWRPRS